MITNINACPFVILIADRVDNVHGLADSYDEIALDYFSVPEVMKLFPTLSKVDILGLCTLSGGISTILKEYDIQRDFENNLQNMIESSSAFVRFMPELLSKYFRKPESYHHILYAIANENHSVSEIGKFTGFAYNKCDNYLSALISCGLVKTEKVLSKGGAEKTAYRLINNYFRLWYLYVYMNRTEIQLGNQKVIANIRKNIIDEEVHKFHLQKAFKFADEKIRWKLWDNFRITEKTVYSPQTIEENDFSYTFDAILRNSEKAIFIKVLSDPFENCKESELEKIRKAVMLANKYYDSHIFIFSKRRFSDYAVAEAAQDYSISLVEVERLKF